MIGGLQGDFGNLDNKYLKQNIPKCRSKYLEMSVEISGNVGRKYMEASGEHRGTVQIWLQNSPGERYQMIQICVTGEVETLSSPIRRQNSGGDTSRWNGRSKIPDVIRVEWRRNRILDVIRVEMAAEYNFGCHPGGMATAAEFRMSSGGGMVAEQDVTWHSRM